MVASFCTGRNSLALQAILNVNLEVLPESHDKRLVVIDRTRLHFVPENVHYMASLHSAKSPMRRWTMAVMCNILDLACVNAWILFNKETDRKISQWDFIHTLEINFIQPKMERRRKKVLV